MTGRPHVAALVVAAGSGERAGAGPPKQFRRIRGETVLAHAVDRLAAHPQVDAVRVVIGAGQEAAYRAAIGARVLPPPAIGGATRQQSVRNGLEALAADGGADIVLIHDAARPFVPAVVVDRLIEACGSHSGAIPAVPVTDSLARSDGTGVAREDFVAVQTPQAFAFDVALAAHRGWSGASPATDDAEVVRAAGHQVAVVAGDPALRKLTFAEDFGAASPALPLVRTGTGYDVHAFALGDHLWLGGVRIAHERGLAGHSDADVALHALTDAILGALGAGDIGSHFPPGDPQWRGAPSATFLDHARGLAAAAGFAIWNVDVTIVCERPKIGPHREAMRARIADILAIPENRVSVKATTTEGLGFAGRREGIAAQAVATLGAEGKSACD